MWGSAAWGSTPWGSSASAGAVVADQVEGFAEVSSDAEAVADAQIRAVGESQVLVEVEGAAVWLSTSAGAADLEVSVVGVARRHLPITLPEMPEDAEIIRLGNYLYVWRAEQIRWRPLGPVPRS